jgi:ApaG protein
MQGLDEPPLIRQNGVMYQALTDQIEITVEPEFQEDRSDPSTGRYFWAYTIEIANLGEETVTLLSRYWKITDGNGKIQEVRGEGVVGEQPTIGPGSSFTYTSGCPLETPQGIMVGAYVMEGPGGEMFSVDIPAFSLDSPYAKRILN